MKALVFGPGEGTIYSARGGRMAFKALGRDTDKAFSLMERSVPPRGSSPRPHRHPGAEGFFMLEGRIDFLIEGETLAAGAGTFVLVPAHVAHTFENNSSEEARLLIIHTPAADGYFAELQDLWSHAEPPAAEAERKLQRRHGWEPA